MTTPNLITEIDPKLDLVLERVVDVSPEVLWTCWTQPEHLEHWFVPKPWSIAGCTIDLQPGGVFHTVMRSPEGQEFPSDGCYLEVSPNHRLIWTSALLPGYRPAPADADLPFTAVLTFTAEDTGTRYTAVAKHRDEAGRQQHEAMGFHEGWGMVLDQLVEYAKGL